MKASINQIEGDVVVPNIGDGTISFVDQQGIVGKKVAALIGTPLINDSTTIISDLITQKYNELQDSAKHTALLIKKYFPDLPIESKIISQEILTLADALISKKEEADILKKLENLQGDIQVFGRAFKSALVPGERTLNLDNIPGFCRKFGTISKTGDIDLINRMKDLYRVNYSHDPEFADLIIKKFDDSIQGSKFLTIYFSQTDLDNPSASSENLVGTLRFSRTNSVDGRVTEYAGAANIDPGFQSFGIMPIVILEAIKERFEQGVEVIVGHSLPGSHAEKLWQAIGFNIVGQEYGTKRKNGEQPISNKIRLDYETFKKMLQSQQYKNLERETTLHEETMQVLSSRAPIIVPELKTDRALETIFDLLEKKGKGFSEIEKEFLLDFFHRSVQKRLGIISKKSLAAGNWIDMDYKNSISQAIPLSIADTLRVGFAWSRLDRWKKGFYQLRFRLAKTFQI